MIEDNLEEAMLFKFIDENQSLEKPSKNDLDSDSENEKMSTLSPIQHQNHMDNENQETNLLFANKINYLEQEFKKENAIASDNTDLEIDQYSKSISKSNVNKNTNYITPIKAAKNFDKIELNEGEMTPKSVSKQTSINMVQERSKSALQILSPKEKLAKIRNQAKNNAIAAKTKSKQ